MLCLSSPLGVAGVDTHCLHALNDWSKRLLDVWCGCPKNQCKGKLWECISSTTGPGNSEIKYACMQGWVVR